MVPVSQSVPGEIEGIWVYYPRGNLALISLSTWCCLAGQGMHAHGYPFGIPPHTNGDPFILTKCRFSCSHVVTGSGQHRKYLWMEFCTKTCFQTIAHQPEAHPCYSCITAAPCTVGKGRVHTRARSSPLFLKEESG